MSDERWPTPEEVRRESFRRLDPAEKLAWLEQAKRFAAQFRGAARTDDDRPSGRGEGR